MYPLCGEDEESVVMFKGRVRSYTLGLRGEVAVITDYRSVLKGNIRLRKGVILLVQHYDYDLDVLKYHDPPDPGYKD